jgi:hypothetical protein
MTCHPGLILLALLTLILLALGNTAGLWAALAALGGVSVLIVALWRRNSWR